MPMPKKQRICQKNDCTEDITQTRRNQRYCSNACRQAAYRDRVYESYWGKPEPHWEG